MRSLLDKRENVIYEHMYTVFSFIYGLLKLMYFVSRNIEKMFSVIGLYKLNFKYLSLIYLKTDTEL